MRIEYATIVTYEVCRLTYTDYWRWAMRRGRGGVGLVGDTVFHVDAIATNGSHRENYSTVIVVVCAEL